MELNSLNLRGVPNRDEGGVVVVVVVTGEKLFFMFYVLQRPALGVRSREPCCLWPAG